MLHFFDYFDESGEPQSVESIYVTDFLNQPIGESQKWLEEYLKFGGLKSVHDISPYYELPEGSKIAEYVANEKEKKVKLIANGMIQYFCWKYNLYDEKNVKRFFKQLARDNGIVVTPHKIENQLAEENPSSTMRIRDVTIKKYLELLCEDGIVNRMMVFDPHKHNYMLNSSAYYFTDIGIAKALNGQEYNKKVIYSSLIENIFRKNVAEITTAKFSKLIRIEDKVTRVYHTVDFLIPETGNLGLAIQVLPDNSANQVKKAVEALTILRGKYEKLIITSPDMETKDKIKDICHEGITVIDINEFLLGN